MQTRSSTGPQTPAHLDLESFSTQKISGTALPGTTIEAHNTSRSTHSKALKVRGDGHFSLPIKSKKGDTVELQLQPPGDSQLSSFFVRNDGPDSWSTLAPPDYEGGAPMETDDFQPIREHMDEEGEPTVDMESVDAPLFIHGVHVDDVEQGAINNCYLACGLSLLAHFRPEVVQNAVRELPDGNFEVTLLEGKYRPTPVKITVNSDLFLDEDGDPIYTHSSTGELWPMILEKAYAQHIGHGSYESIGQGGKAGDVIRAFTGEPYMMYEMPSAESADKVFEEICTTVAENRPASAGTYPDKERYKGKKIYANHNYAILDAGSDTKTGQPYLVMRNPWGNSEPDYMGESDETDDGIFKITIEDFMRHFMTYSVVTESRRR